MTYNMYNTYNTYKSYSNHFQDRRMFPSLTQVHSRRTWTQCLSEQRLRTGAILGHTRLFPATLQKLHGRFLAAESWQGPGGDCRRTFLQETGCSISAAHQGIWCVLAPNNCTERNDPCVGLNLAAPMTEEGLIPDKIIHIKCIDRIIANKQNNGYNQTMAMVLGLPRYAAEIHGFNIIINGFNAKLKRNN